MDKNKTQKSKSQNMENLLPIITFYFNKKIDGADLSKFQIYTNFF